MVYYFIQMEVNDTCIIYISGPLLNHFIKKKKHYYNIVQIPTKIFSLKFKLGFY